MYLFYSFTTSAAVSRGLQELNQKRDSGEPLLHAQRICADSREFHVTEKFGSGDVLLLTYEGLRERSGRVGDVLNVRRHSLLSQLRFFHIMCLVRCRVFSYLASFTRLVWLEQGKINYRKSATRKSVPQTERTSRLVGRSLRTQFSFFSLFGGERGLRNAARRSGITRGCRRIRSPEGVLIRVISAVKMRTNPERRQFFYSFFCFNRLRVPHLLHYISNYIPKLGRTSYRGAIPECNPLRDIG